jgi:hypothetical protein
VGLGEWEERVAAEPGAEGRIQEVEDELRRDGGLEPIRSFTREEFNELIVANREGYPVRIKDVGAAEIGRKVQVEEPRRSQPTSHPTTRGALDSSPPGGRNPGVNIQRAFS